MNEPKFVWRYSTPIIPSLTARTVSIAASNQKLPDSVIKSAQVAINGVDVSGETIRLAISLKSAVDFLHVTYIREKQMPIFNFIFDLWTSRGSSICSVTLFGFRELKQIEKHGSRCKRLENYVHVHVSSIERSTKSQHKERSQSVECAKFQSGDETKKSKMQA